MRNSRFIVSFLSLFATSISASNHRFEHDYVPDAELEDFTFGGRTTVWGNDHKNIKGWSISGEGYIPELHSDRVILTPPWPSSRRGAIWADHAESEPEWEAEFEFRASGADNGNGHFQFWYVRNDSTSNGVGTSSIYTADRFDGLAIVVNQDRERGGQVRAFLNDGSFAYKDHHNVDQLSFGQCDFNYRNLGTFSKIKIIQSFWSFKVEVDDKKCIESYSIHLPHNYYYGITAASSDPPDSFEVKSFIVHKLKEGKRIVHDHGPGIKADWHDYDNENEQWAHDAADTLREHGYKAQDIPPGSTPNPQAPLTGRGAAAFQSKPGDEWMWTSQAEQIPQRDAAQIKAENERFKDLHDRVSLVNHQLDLLYSDLTLWKKQMESYHQEVMSTLHTMSTNQDVLNTLRTMSGNADATRRTVDTLEKEVDVIKKALGTGNLKGLLDQLHWVVNDNHLTMTQAIAGNSPRMTFFACLIVVSNILILGSYMVYLKRKENQHQKYL